MLSLHTLDDDNDSVLYDDVGVLGGVRLAAIPPDAGLLLPFVFICSLRFFLASLSFSSVI